ncbi:MAG: hypothetical protein LBV04_04190 [Deferribacteraceae bacterium]|jgi:hypothetical protein|nr:hypothetical protein [Deferribacteraceae bacterium]
MKHLWFNDFPKFSFEDVAIAEIELRISFAWDFKQDNFIEALQAAGFTENAFKDGYGKIQHYYEPPEPDDEDEEYVETRVYVRGNDVGVDYLLEGEEMSLAELPLSITSLLLTNLPMSLAEMDNFGKVNEVYISLELSGDFDLDDYIKALEEAQFQSMFKNEEDEDYPTYVYTKGENLSWEFAVTDVGWYPMSWTERR